MAIKIKSTLFLICITLIGLLVWIYAMNNKGESLSLEKIKDRIKDTEQIYVCNLRNSLKKLVKNRIL